MSGIETLTSVKWRKIFLIEKILQLKIFLKIFLIVTGIVTIGHLKWWRKEVRNIVENLKIKGGDKYR